MPSLPLDDRNIAWNTIDGFDHMAYYIYDLDERSRILKAAAIRM